MEEGSWQNGRVEDGETEIVQPSQLILISARLGSTSTAG